jgi:hypothetical protein
VEQSLVEYVGHGKRLDLAVFDQAVDEAAMRSWGDSRTCRASVIRDILRGRLAEDPDPHGLRLRGARITGQLDLENLSTDVNLMLEDCLLEEGVLARGAHLAGIGLTGCQIEHYAEPPLNGTGLSCRVLFLDRTRITGHASSGAVRLVGAHIGGQLSFSNAELRNESGPALNADSLQVDQAMLLTGGFTATGSGGLGAVRLAAAHIGGQLSFSNAELRNESGPALNADSLQVGQAMLLTGGFTATGSGGLGAVNLSGAHIGGQLACTQAKLRNESGPALSADSLQVDQDVFLRREFTATGTGGLGAVNLSGAHIGGQLSFSNAELRNESGPALNADSLQVGQVMLLTSEFTATGSGGLGAVRLTQAHIGGLLDCSKAKLCNESGPALSADGLQVGQAMLLTSGFTAIGGGDSGAIRLSEAQIGGQLGCEGAELRNESGPALIANNLQVDGAMFLRGRFTGSHSAGAIRLTGAHIGGQLGCEGAELRNESGPALAADSLQVDQAMYLTDGFAATGGGEGVVINLTGVRVGGAFIFHPARLEHKTDSRRRLAVEGMTYADVPGQISPECWRELLRHGTPRYAAQPYQQLASGYRALGDDRQVRETLMRQRDDQLARTDVRWLERMWGQITRVTLGYGYQPWRALLFLAGLVVASCVLTWLLGAHGALAQTNKTRTAGRSCTVIQQLSVGLDLNLPVGTTIARSGCDLTSDSASVTAAWLSAAGWVMRVLAWAFAALFFAGFTSAVRKT